MCAGMEFESLRKGAERSYIFKSLDVFTLRSEEEIYPMSMLGAIPGIHTYVLDSTATTRLSNNSPKMRRN
ncbi:predicted protein [Uncinocarpus reesii 1704]|uniref:Uncharacterized protein n=1 Tax=Uncinocarpus reesii (strain UAMH 1704) TaxID=336963 RepID=C4JVH1_UNCRE|nr:uncharacterized protein UREG_06563 [Uncinocarpus reesii 1704]EEP81698.1 predicted protein [Uncinocarpus reesii 1704]